MRKAIKAVSPPKNISVTCQAKDYKPLDALNPLQGELATLSAQARIKLWNNISEHGITFAFSVWYDSKKNKNYLLDGHARLKVLKEMQKAGSVIDSVPIVTVDAKSMREAKKKLLAGRSEYHKTSDQGLLDFLGGAGLGVDDIIDTTNLLDMDSFESKFAGHPCDEKTEIEEVPKTKPGDLYQLGNHRLLCGDATNSADVAKLLDGETVDMIVTDPPYNVAYRGSVTKERSAIENDKMTNQIFSAFLHDSFKNISKHLRAGGSFYIWHANSEAINFRTAASEAGLEVKSTLIWNKNAATFSRSDYHNRFEPCLYGWKEGASHRWYGGHKQTTVFDFKKPARSELHPTMKPVPLFERQIRNSSLKGDIVLDTFGGSGTMLIACENSERRGRSIEMNPHYCDVIIARWEDCSGEKAVKIGGKDGKEKNSKGN